MTTKQKYTPPTERGAEIVAALMKQNLTRRELGEYLGIDMMGKRNASNLSRWIQAFRASGVVRIADYRRAAATGNLSEAFGLQPSPFALPDAQRPPKVRKGRA